MSEARGVVSAKTSFTSTPPLFCTGSTSTVALNRATPLTGIFHIRPPVWQRSSTAPCCMLGSDHGILPRSTPPFWRPFRIDGAPASRPVYTRAGIDLLPRPSSLLPQRQLHSRPSLVPSLSSRISVRTFKCARITFIVSEYFYPYLANIHAHAHARVHLQHTRNAHT